MLLDSRHSHFAFHRLPGDRAGTYKDTLPIYVSTCSIKEREFGIKTIRLGSAFLPLASRPYLTRVQTQ